MARQSRSGSRLIRTDDGALMVVLDYGELLCHDEGAVAVERGATVPACQFWRADHGHVITPLDKTVLGDPMPVLRVSAPTV